MNTIFDDYKIRQANEVLKRLLKMKNLPKNVFYLDTYQNCRESGYVIRGYFYAHTKDKTIFGGEIYVAFSENRNSDNIVVYFDTAFNEDSTNSKRIEGISTHGNIPNLRAYENCVYFGYKQYDEAAKFIYKTLKGFIKKAKHFAELAKSKPKK